ncbi:MAG: EAL domain-containing protein [Proteobacteria bacterium]|nr:EAL domain-containing protein [Pseudomonadota bacterium]
MIKDINQDSSIIKDLQKSDERLRFVTDALPVVISYLNVEQYYQFNNAAFEKRFGVSRETTINKHIKEVIGHTTYEQVKPYIDAALSGKEISFEFTDKCHDGGFNTYEVLYLPHINSEGSVIGLYILSNDITFRKQAERKLFEEKERAQVTLNSIGDAVITTDASGIIEFMNPTAEKMTGWTIEEAKNQALQHVFKIVNEETLQPVSNPVQQCLEQGRIIGLANHTVLKNLDGKEFAIQDSAAPIRDRNGEIIGVVLVFNDVTESRRMAREITYHASHDTLTGLVNRRELEHRLNRILETVISDNNTHAFCYLDLDQFKVINDTCGHMAGDELLRRLGSTLLEIVRKRDTVARLGGDEFAILMEHCTIVQAEKIANNIRKKIDTFKFIWEGKSFNIGVSIGIVEITPASKSIANILSMADAACYAAKNQGRNRVVIYQNDNSAVSKHYGEMQWVSRINQSLKDGTLALYYQSISPIDPARNIPPLFEFLIRMKDGDNIIPAHEFLPAAEQYNLSSQIDRWVIDTTKNWLTNPQNKDSFSGLLTINLSGHSLGNADFLSYLISQLEGSQLQPEILCFEITETATITNLNSAVEFMNRLKELGCKFALDDFGSGLSSFAYLKNLPIDFLKIDGMFVRDIVQDKIACSMVKSINEIGQVMGMFTIAEWVENQDILDKLKEIGVDYVQGYHINHPQPLIGALPTYH